jgi:hypothetical protein
MARLLGMGASLGLPIDHNPTNLTLDSHAPRVGIVMLSVEFLA